MPAFLGCRPAARRSWGRMAACPGWYHTQAAMPAPLWATTCHGRNKDQPQRMNHPKLQLKKNEDRRLRAGHLWIFSNEVDTGATPLTGLETGSLVDVVARNGRPLGTAVVNPHSLICARLIGRATGMVLDKSLIKHRINIAAGLRRRLYGDGASCRLVFGEADGLPGLVVDRMANVLAVQTTTAGMDRRTDAIIAALKESLKPDGIVLRNDNPVRRLENLEEFCEVADGTVPERVTIEEGGLNFTVDPRAGQKTGWFFDQADNRRRLARHLPDGARVLDLYSYAGAWGLQAAAAGAAEVLCVDQSEAALAEAAANARGNNLDVETRQGEVMDVLRALRAEERKFDVVICDPPALIRRRKDWKPGRRAYRQLNQAALQLVAPDGLLVTSSCSFHMPERELLRTVQAAGKHLDRALQLLETGHQGPDHPVHPAIPETAYLKTLFLRVLMSW